MWLVSNGGFTEDVMSYINDREDIYASGHDKINEIFLAYGGNYTIPVFEQNP